MPPAYPVRQPFQRPFSRTSWPSERGLVGVRLLPPPLGVAAALLVIQPTSPAARGRLRLRPRARDVQGAVQPRGKPLESQFAVARLRSRVLRDGGHARPEFGAYPRFLNVVQGVRLANVEGRLD